MAAVKDKISIIIVTHNSRPVLEDCLTSLKGSLNGNHFEIINVDNRSSDDSPSHVRRHFPQATVIVNPKNVGFAAACNRAAQEATGEYLLFLNPDVIVDENAVEQLVKTLKSREDAGVVVGRMRFPDGSFQATCRNFPQIDNMLHSRGSVFSKLLRDGTAYTLPDYNVTTPIPAAAGTMMMLRNDLFNSVGGFDQRFFVFLEDVDLCLRLALRGHRNYFVPSAGGVHLWGRGSSAGKLKRNWYHHWAVWKYFRKHYPTVFSLFVLPLVLAVNFLLVTLLPVPQPINRK
jgi:GT2 family glycosyltransferase